VGKIGPVTKKGMENTKLTEQTGVAACRRLVSISFSLPFPLYR
jgi:hypothetical protein